MGKTQRRVAVSLSEEEHEKHGFRRGFELFGCWLPLTILECR